MTGYIPLNVYDCHLVQFVIENAIIAFVHHQRNTAYVKEIYKYKNWMKEYIPKF